MLIDKTVSANAAEAQILSERMRNVFDAADGILQHSNKEIDTNGFRNPSEAIKDARDLIHRFGRELSYVLIIDSNGDLKASTLTETPPQINYADRPYFKAHKTGTDLLIGAPILGRTSQKMILPFTRAILAPDRSFNGVLFAGIDLERITDDLIVNSAGPEGARALFHLDGTLLARDPPEGVAKSYPDARVFAELRQASSGSYFAKSLIVGGEWLISYSAVENYPLVITVGKSKSITLAPWRRNVPLVISLEMLWLVAFFMVARRNLKQTELLARNEERSRQLLKKASDGIHILDTQGNVIEVSDSFCRMLGYTRSEMIGSNVSAWDANFSSEDLPKIISQQLDLQETSTFETRHRRKDGSILDVEITGYPIDLDGRLVLYNSARDISERKRTDQQLLIAATAFEAQEGMVITDAKGTILQVNRAFTEITGYSSDEAVGQKTSLLKSGRHDETFYSEMWKSIVNRSGWQGEIWNRRKNGEVYPEWLSITAVKNAVGEVINYVATLSDISLRKAAEDEIKHLAFYDPLTRLPNRRLLIDRLRQALASSSRSLRAGALLFIDLDNFKTLNDTLGHDVGDVLLQQVSQRVTACVREGDTVARLGGDEFVVMLEDLSSDIQEAVSQTDIVVEKILTALNRPFLLAGHDQRSTPSIGATLFQGHHLSIEELLKRADLAMYQAKAAGRNTSRFFDPEMQAVVSARASLEADLRHGIEQGQFLLYYQPQVNAEFELIGAEALLRWHHPERGIVSPAEFIPVSEETGLILPLGAWVLETACKQLSFWANNPKTDHYTLAVNVSARQFRQPDFVDQVLASIDRTGANPRKLKLELTESLFLKDIQDVVAKMTALKAKGVYFSLDDFGTGYSSLSYLKRLPLDQLKIDKSFVGDVLIDMNDGAIAQTIIALGQTMGLAVIAEGVETKEQCDFLARLGCNAYQGYFFSRPLSLEDFERFIVGKSDGQGLSDNYIQTKG